MTFLLEDINQDRAEKVYDTLNQSSEEFNELNDRYAKVNVSTNAQVQEFEIKYMTNVDKVYSAVV